MSDEDKALFLNGHRQAFYEAKSDLVKGFQEQCVTAFLEQSGGLLTKLPFASHMQAFETKVMRAVAGKTPRGVDEALGPYLKRLAKVYKFGTPTGEVAEEIVKNMTNEALFGEGNFLDGLPDDFLEKLDE